MLFGTNAVGKSSLIRSIGMSIVLAQAGFYVPCKSFVYKPYSAIFTRILGNDDIFKGLSTFAVEMSELSSIMKTADNNSLVLGDELCSGTETTSALCIVSAGVEMLHNKNTSFIFATHFHELTTREELMNLNRLSLQHMVVRYDEKLKCLIYDRKLKDGPGNKLYGLEVCKALSMPNDFLKLANQYRCKYGNEQNTILNSRESRYNSKKLKNICEICKKDAAEIHHMQPQCDSNEEGFIGSFHKNHPANLMSICKKCHEQITKDNIKHRRVKTGMGMTHELI
jgi:DNA mismatch repair protein MutS